MSGWDIKIDDETHIESVKNLTIDEKGNVYLVAEVEGDYILEFSPQGEFITRWELAFNSGACAVDVGPECIYVALKKGIQKLDRDGRPVAYWGSRGSSDGRFGRFDVHNGISVDSSSNVYVADPHNDRIQMFSPDGHFVTKWELEDFYIGIEIRGPEHLYLLNSVTVAKLDIKTGKLSVVSEINEENDFSEFYNDFAISSAGHIYVLDRSGLVRKFDLEGKLTKTWETVREGAGHVFRPETISVDSQNNVYVVGFKRIRKFTSEGNLVRDFDNIRSVGGAETTLEELAFDLSGNMYITDYLNDRVIKLDAKGKVIAYWGSSGSGPGEFDGPRSIVVDKNGKVYVVDRGNNRIQIFQPKKKEEGAKKSEDLPSGSGESGGGSYIGKTPEVTAKEVKWGEAIKGLKASVGTDKEVYERGDDPEFTFSLKNVGDERIACVLPSRDEKSHFPALLTFSITRKGTDDSIKRMDCVLNYEGKGGYNPGSNEYAEIRKGELYSTAFKFSELVSGHKPIKLLAGEYTVTVTYFIRASTPKYGPAIPDVKKWAGHHLKTNKAKFVVKQGESEEAGER